MSRGPDALAYEDLSITAGERYAYQLTYEEDGRQRHTEEVWVEVPTTSLALHGFSPNPSTGTAVISLEIPASGDTEIEVLDISGRRLTRQRLRGLHTGDHVVDLRKSLPPGLYVIRLRFNGQELVARGWWCGDMERP